MKGTTMHVSRLLPFAAFTIAAVSVGTIASAAHVISAWARPGNDNVAVYLILTNNTNKATTLVSVTSPISRQAEIHRSYAVDSADMSGMKMDGTAMQTVGAITVEPHQHIDFAPGGYHIMLSHLYRGLKPGQRFPLILIFRNKTREIVPVTVTGTGK
jgi:copper(I)-binding protein